MTKKAVVVALGGNAILRHQEMGTAEEQFANVRRTSMNIVKIIREGYAVAVTHGNGPQVGDILLRNEMAKDTLPPMPLDICGAESQGMIGYMLQQSLNKALRSVGLDFPVVTVLTQTVVDADDPAFGNPTKPIGPFYTAMQARRLMDEKGWKMVHIRGRGYRRVVPSPRPIALVEGEAITRLVRDGMVVIAAGGGGIPVVAGPGGSLRGVEGVVDKDYTAALLARLIGADDLLILTDVEYVFLNYGCPGQQALREMTVAEAKQHLAATHFPPGSMGPKIEAAIRFLEDGGRRVVITSLDSAGDALAGRVGTWIHR
ncbi:MAG TPA: carbamate kinase [Candidatus Methanoculleus thermohydrogenotrophicum]|jgi:carbamate kinase|nr:carbamate kinase [Candidatus Methanoculleus thermohydrogenotrophicum]NLM81090.1 carbamate kinase [Candidatus Methanoculleus thermohydrogenotrophicum]HOB17168.1 carbamate kinase [Candidatus Methanoculleus thermohydrogenotrophicum]HPZ37247.1 carbamate kinase [Candidatus Methanoculleus thermohydrogenotrophicum]HQC90539.1 carbamate kinase [Candidatus Methanoculleus thermohydrogenotrophicum]